MPIQKQDVRRGVKLLRNLQDEIDDEKDPDLNDAVVKLLAVFQSRLFKALVELQTTPGPELREPLGGSMDSGGAYADSVTSVASSSINGESEADMPRSQSTPRRGNTHNPYDTASNGSVSSLASDSVAPAPSHGTSRPNVAQAKAIVSQTAARKSSLVSQGSRGGRPLSMEWEPDVWNPELSSDEASQLATLDETVPLTRETIALSKSGGGLGMTIHGGKDKMHLPGDPSIYVTAVIPDHAASRDGRLQVGDKILSVNGLSMENVTHLEAVRALKMSPRIVSLEVAHGAMLRRKAELLKLRSGLELQTHEAEIQLHKLNGGLGFSIAGGVGSPHVAGDSGIFIVKMAAGGAAELDGRLSVGDKLLAINGQTCVGIDHDAAVDYLKSAHGAVMLRVEHNAFHKSAWEVSKALGLSEAPQPRFTRTGTLRRFGSKESSGTLNMSTTDTESLMGDETASVGKEPVRRVTLELKEAKSFGFNIIGPIKAGPPQEEGDLAGVFVSKIIDGGAAQLSGHMSVGDQILSLNGHSLEFSSYTDAADLIRRASRPFFLELIKNTRMYNRFQHKIKRLKKQVVEDKQKTDPSVSGPMYARALFEYDPVADEGISAKDKKLKLLRVSMLEVFMVTSTSNADWWEVRSMATDEVGFIPSRSKQEARQQEASRAAFSKSSSSSSLQGEIAQGSQGKRKRSRSFRFAKRLSFRSRRKSARKANGDEASLHSSGSRGAEDDAKPAYVRVELKAQSLGRVRPLIILGPSKDYFTDRLITDYPDLFGSCVPHTTRPSRPEEIDGLDYHFVSQDQMNTDAQLGKFVEVGEFSGNLYGTSIEAVKEVASQGQMCILDVSAHAIGKLLAAEVHPIAMFLKPATVDIVRQQNEHYSPEMAQTVFSLAKQVEEEFCGQFSNVVQNTDVEETYREVVAVILSESRECYWTRSPVALP